MPEKGVLTAVAIIAVSFTGLVGIIIILWVSKIVSSAMAIFMIVALVGLYFGFGVLIAVYRLVDKLE